MRTVRQSGKKTEKGKKGGWDSIDVFLRFKKNVVYTGFGSSISYQHTVHADPLGKQRKIQYLRRMSTPGNGPPMKALPNRVL